MTIIDSSFCSATGYTRQRYPSARFALGYFIISTSHLPIIFLSTTRIYGSGYPRWCYSRVNAWTERFAEGGVESVERSSYSAKVEGHESARRNSCCTEARSVKAETVVYVFAIYLSFLGVPLEKTSFSLRLSSASKHHLIFVYQKARLLYYKEGEDQ